MRPYFKDLQPNHKENWEEKPKGTGWVLPTFVMETEWSELNGPGIDYFQLPKKQMVLSVKTWFFSFSL